MSLIEYIGSIGGIVSVFGYLIFLAYKSTVKQMREDRIYMEDRLNKIIEADQTSREKHTQVLSELITYLRLKNGAKSSN